MKTAQNTIVEVIWQDTQTVVGWTKPEDIDKAEPPTVRTVGYYHGCRREHGKIRWVILKHNLGIEDGDADFTLIPFGMILKVNRIG